MRALRLGFRRVVEAASLHGQALVEAAVALPIILLLALGTFDLGRALFAHIALREATQEGAIYAAYHPSEVSNIQVRVTTSSDHPWVQGAAVTRPSCAATPGTVTVRSEYNLDLLTPPFVAIFGPTLPLAVEIHATNFGGPC